MSKIDEYIAKRSSQDPKFAKDIRAENEKLRLEVERSNKKEK